MFRKTKEYKEIKAELKLCKILEEYAIFECYGDSIFTYGYTKDNVYHEFCVICDDDLAREMQIEDLINLKRISYFRHRVFIMEPKKSPLEIGSSSWSLNEHASLN